MPLSDDLKNEVLAPVSSKAFFYLIEIDDVLLSAPYRIVNNNVDLTSNGNVYEANAFSIVLPNQNDKIPKSKLVIDNTDKRIYNEIVSALTEEISANVSMIMSSDLDYIEQGPINFKMTNAIHNKKNVTFDLTFEDNLSEIFPGDDITPENFSGLF
jgi:hypothetical protein